MAVETLKYMLEVEIEIEGMRPSDEVLHDRFIEAMDESFLNVAFDDEELDCTVFVKTWFYTPVSPSVDASHSEEA